MPPIHAMAALDERTRDARRGWMQREQNSEVVHETDTASISQRDSIVRSPEAADVPTGGV